MSDALATAFVDVRPRTSGFAGDLKKQLDSSAAAAQAIGGKTGDSFAKALRGKVVTAANAITKGLALGAVGVGAASVVMASKFDSAMERIVTQAGVGQDKLGALKTGVEQLAGQVGFAPDSLADSLYHVESNFSSMGITSAKALDIVKVAAEGAAVGGADLTDVTNALTAAVASGIPGVQNMQQAMGALNAIVGAGDMKMQDLSEAFGTGMVAAVKGFGLSLKDVGAALDVFGDNNIRGAKAGTDLRMSVMALAAPTKAGISLLQGMGIKSGQLAKDMRTGGLLKAMDDLTGSMRRNGVTAKEQGDVITQAFGKKAGTGLNILADQMDRLRSKYPALTKGASDFGEAWKRTNATSAQQFKELESAAEALAVKIGNRLLPDVMDLLNFVKAHLGAVLTLAGTIAGLAVTISAVSFAIKAWQVVTVLWTAATKAASAAMFLFDSAMDANPIGLIIIAIAALAFGIVELVKHSTGFRNFWKGVWKDAKAVIADVWNWIKGHWPLLLGILLGPIALAVAEIIQHWHAVSDAAKTAFRDVEHAVGDALNWIKGHWPAVAAILAGPIGVTVLEISRHWAQITAGARQMGADVVSFFRALPGKILGAVGDLGHLLWNAGEQIVQGLISGIESMVGDAIGAIEHLGGSIVSAAKSILKIFSPSKVFRDIGLMIGKGLIQGLEGTQSQVKSAASKLASAVTKAFNAGLISDKRATSLTDFIHRDNMRLQALATRRTAILKTIAAAKTFATNTATSVESGSQLTNLASVQAAQNGTGSLSAGSIETDLQGQLSSIHQFSAALKQLAKEGLNKNMLNQIIQAGPVQGLQIAQALLSGPISAIKQINSTQAQITSSSNALGKTAANLMFDTGKQAGKGFLSGLEAQRAAITKLMDKIAKELVKKLKDGLGVKSPSTVMAGIGKFVGAGLIGGMDSTRTAIISAAGRMAGAAIPRAGRLTLPAAPGAASGQPVKFEFEFTGSGGSELERALWTWAKKQIRIRGGNPAVLGA